MIERSSLERELNDLGLRVPWLGREAGRGVPRIDIERAVRRNRHYGERLGWAALRHHDRIVRLLGFTDQTPDERTFAEAVARWQRAQGLAVDGIIGPDTWRRMQAALGGAAPEVPPATTQPAVPVGGTVTFANGASLPVVAGPEGTGEDYFDPNGSGNPLLDTSGPYRSTRVSKDFTVGEFAKSGRTRFDRARIDPQLVSCVQAIRDSARAAVVINSGYRSFAYNRTLVRKKEERAQARARGVQRGASERSQHLSGRAVDIRVRSQSGKGWLSGVEIAKHAIDVCGCRIGVGIAPDYAHVDVRGCFAAWRYSGKATKDQEAEVERYHAARCPPAARCR